MAEKAILYDATICTGCRGCQAACKEWNETDEVFPQEINPYTESKGIYNNPGDLQPTTWLKMNYTEVEHYGKTDWLFSRRSCMHCVKPACVAACPNGTLYIDQVYGFVGLNSATCTGCGYCEEFCPFNVPRLSGSSLLGKTRAFKCIACMNPGLNRLDAGQVPACVKSCPPSALLYDDRDKLLTVGKDKVAALKAKGFTNAYLYGQIEAGSGTHVLYVLADTPDKYGLPVNPKYPDTVIAWKDIIQPIGWAVGGLTILGLALNYIIARETNLSKNTSGKKEKK